MGLILLVAVGAVFGWLASIMTRLPGTGADMVLIASGVLSATVAGLAVYDGSVLTGLSPQAFVAAALSCAIVLAAVTTIRSHGIEQTAPRKRD